MPPVLIGLLLLAASPVKAARPSWAEYAFVRPEETVENLWARALFVTALAHVWNPPEDLAGRLFVAALDRADRPTRARILVTMGDYEAGFSLASAAEESLERVAQEAEDIGGKGAVRRAEAREAAEELAAAPGQAKRLAEVIEAGRGDDAEERFARVGREMLQAMGAAKEQGRVGALEAYAAAVRIDPGNLGAWFRLVWVTEGKAQDAALDELRRRDPENALPWIAAGVVLIERKRFVEAIAPLRAAAERKVCRLYPSPLPQAFRLRFPNDEGFRSLHVAGQPVSTAALRHLLRTWKEITDGIGGNRWESRVCDALAWSTEDYVTASVKVGMLRQAEDLTDARYRAGRAMLALEPPEALAFVDVLLAVGAVAPEAVSVHHLAGHDAEAAEVQRFLDHFAGTKTRREELRPRDPPEDWFVRVVRGEWDEIGRWERYVVGMQEALGVRDAAEDSGR
jgi:hypothetical protein